MKVEAIELLIVSLGGEVPDGLKEVKEAEAKRLACDFLTEKGHAVEGLSLDQLDELIKAIDAAPAATSDAALDAALDEGSDRVKVILPHAIEVRIGTCIVSFSCGEQLLPANTVDSLLSDGIKLVKVS